MSGPNSAQATPGRDAPLPDAITGHWVDRRAPRAIRPFLKLARIERPIGWWLLLLPCWWAAGLAAIAAGQPYPDPWHCLIFLVGAVLMRGAGCTFNDIVDRKLDAEVARTRGRPLPSGQVTAKAAALFMVAQALGGLVVLMQFNRFTILLGIASLAIVAVYPFMKRVTDMPQFVLGLAFSWGGLMGWSAVFGRLDPPAFLIYAAAIAWTVGYDTIYAMQDLEDDVIAGIRSSARYFGGHTREAVALCFALAAGLSGAAIWQVGGGLAAWLGFAAFALHLARQVTRINGASAAQALSLFRSNRDAGLMLAAGLALDAMSRNWLLG
ncbi:4-hydroxybenzoate octaprenyltransferase [Bosea sp. (in: a-proteobacteria)]|uniref:4-hydroxybenzoate octaprenyltransferase n=1 Tax=Bosea sp. (in: a-proteobacteria) TaxID=1871050 RepID=UPI0026098FBB|nr:4-hydroxybenzoate octaprenyltransferase [Bosea sp. (in: a-proteobacteria)]MCO5092318.1 4-hydroxybenzoate octaprenyltransferase [Bosea sp. (in: a-proteobacteria)]